VEHQAGNLVHRSGNTKKDYILLLLLSEVWFIFFLQRIEPLPSFKTLLCALPFCVIKSKWATPHWLRLLARLVSRLWIATFQILAKSLSHLSFKDKNFVFHSSSQHLLPHVLGCQGIMVDLEPHQ